MGQASDHAPQGGGQERPQRQEPPRQEQPAQQGPTLAEQAASLLPSLGSFVPDLGAKASAFLPSLDQLKPEIEKLGNTVAEGLAQLGIGGVMSVVRELAVDALPQSWKSEIYNIVDDLTKQLGGKPQHGKGQESPGHNGQQHQQQEQGGQKGHEKQDGKEGEKQGGKEGHGDNQGAQRGRREPVGQG